MAAAGPLTATPRAVPLEERGPRFTGKLTPEDVTAPEVPGLSERPSSATGTSPAGWSRRPATCRRSIRSRPPPRARYGRANTSTLPVTRAALCRVVWRSYLDELQKDAKRLREGSDVTGPNVVTDTIDSLEKQRGKPLTLQAAWNIDKWLGKKISAEYDAGGLSEYGRELQGMQRRLKEHIDNAGEGDITGGKEGFEALKKGRQTYTIATRMSDLERMEEIAQGTLNPQQSLRTQINRYVNHEAKTRGWTDADIADLKKAGQRGNDAGGDGVAQQPPAGHRRHGDGRAVGRGCHDGGDQGRARCADRCAHATDSVAARADGHAGTTRSRSTRSGARAAAIAKICPARDGEPSRPARHHRGDRTR